MVPRSEREYLVYPVLDQVRVQRVLHHGYRYFLLMSRTRHHGMKQKQRQFGENWWWMMNYPRSWDHLQHTKPRRAAERQSLHDAVKRPDHDVIHPLDHKPHRYYW